LKYLDNQNFLIILTIKTTRKERLPVAAKKEKIQPNMPGGALNCCQVEAMVSVDEKGQMVLPKTIRDKANIRPGDKLLLVGWEKEGEVCCITMIKAESLAGMVRGLLGPMMKDIMAS
jgi:AbrB family looped-hinge helix DNA binding protein